MCAEPFADEDVTEKRTGQWTGILLSCAMVYDGLISFPSSRNQVIDRGQGNLLYKSQLEVNSNKVVVACTQDGT
jgi:hypothetical protein